MDSASIIEIAGFSKREFQFHLSLYFRINSIENSIDAFESLFQSINDSSASITASLNSL